MVEQQPNKKDGAPEARRQVSSPDKTTSPKYANGADRSTAVTNANGKAPGKRTLAEVAAHNRRVALAWAAAGFRVFPCRPVDWRLADGIILKAKMPRVSWGEEATTDATVINAWWDRWADSLPAIVLMNSGIVALDPDRHAGGPDGVAAWRKLCVENDWDDSKQPVVSTSGGGEHIYFKQPDGEPLNNSEGDLPDAINIRANGYTIAPGAMLPDGRKWRTRKGSPELMEAVKNGAIPPVPDWLVKILRAQKTPERAKREASQPKGVIGPRERAYAAKALKENAAELATTQEGKRNGKLNAIAFRMGRMIGAGWIERSAVERALESACITNGLKPIGDDAAGNPEEVATTMLSGIEAGMTQPMTLPNGLDPTKYFETVSREVIEQDGVLIAPQPAPSFSRRRAKISSAQRNA